MSTNKVDIIINSRRYTVLADEEPSYIRKLGDHLNEKIRMIHENGKNVMGERPLVIAALNICDEFYKLSEHAENSEGMAGKLAAARKDNKKLVADNKKLKASLDELMSAQVTIDETEMVGELTKTHKELEESRTQIKFLEGQIKRMEDKLGTTKEEYKKREENLLRSFGVK